MERPTNENNYSQNRESFLTELSQTKSISSIVDDFAKHARRQELTRFLFRHEIFKMTSSIKGSILECGVHTGNGLFSWAQLASILEPMGFFRKIVGFDTFAGFPSIHEKDNSGTQDKNVVGDFKSDSYEELIKCRELFDQNRLLNHFPKLEFIKGDFMETGEKFLEDNPHTLISVLYLDFDLYEPTKKALELFLPRIPKGGVIGFDEVNNPQWAGETLALLESMNLNKQSLKCFPFEPNMAYLVVE